MRISQWDLTHESCASCWYGHAGCVRPKLSIAMIGEQLLLLQSHHFQCCAAIYHTSICVRPIWQDKIGVT